MATQTRTDADAVLKDYYLGPARNILNSKVFFLSQINRNTEDIDGRDAVLAINTGRNEGVGARAEMGTLPEAGRQRYVNERVRLKYNYGRIELSGPVMASTRTNRGSFLRIIKAETQGVVRDTKNDYNRQIHGTANGVLFTVAAAGPTNTLTIQNPDPVKRRHIRKNMRIDIHTPPNFTADEASNRLVTAVAGDTFTIDGAAVTVEAGDTVTRSGSGGSGANQVEITGLQTQVSDTGALFNIDPAVDPDWKSYVDANGGVPRAVALAMFEKAQLEVDARFGEPANLWVTSEGVLRAAANLLTGLKRFPNSNKLKGGFSGLDMSVPTQGDGGTNEVTMVHEKDAPYDQARLINTSKFQHYMMSDWEFMDKDGALFSRVPGKDAYEATLYVYSEPATDARNAHAAVLDLTPAP